MRGWVAGTFLGSAICVTAAVLGVGVYQRGAIVAWAAPKLGKVMELRFRPPAPLAVHKLPPLPAPTALPFVGPEGSDADGYPRKTPSILGLRALLVERRFDDLTRYVAALEHEAELDIKKEYWALDSTRGFMVADPSLEPLLDEWVTHDKGSFAPYAARGIYRAEVGWYERGDAYSSKTSPAQFAALAHQLALAREDLTRALALRPRALSPRLALITASKSDSEVRNEFARAVADFPESFLVRYYAMLGLTPRWGGSYAELERMALDAAKQASKNSRMLTLGGFADYARAEDLSTAKDYAGAVTALDRAVTHGELWLYLDERGDAKNRLLDYAGAALDLRRARGLRPEQAKVERDLAFATHHLKSYEEAGEAYLYAVRLDPTRFADTHTYAAALEFAGRAHWSAGEPREALRDFDDALLLEPKYADVRRWRAEIYSHGDPDANPAELAAAVARAEADDTFEAYLAVDNALSRRGRFAEIIRHWSAHLDRHPADGRGFVERGGALTHVGRFDEALHDVDRACELGVERGCALVARLPELRKSYQAQRLPPAK
jgi:tetratricopeptide (TPR) repeat protein